MGPSHYANSVILQVKHWESPILITRDYFSKWECFREFKTEQKAVWVSEQLSHRINPFLFVEVEIDFCNLVDLKNW